MSYTGSIFVLGPDPIDDHVVEDVLGPLRDVYFPPELAELQDPLVLEVGAHSGIVAVELLRCVPGSRLIALEPHPGAVARLRRNVHENGMTERCEILHAALAAHDGVTVLRISREGSWGDSTAPGDNEASYQPGGIRVRCLTLATALSGRRPDVVVCNGEGAEFTLIPQLMALELRPRLMVLMTHPRHADTRPLLDTLRSASYDVTPVGVLPDHFHCRAQVLLP